MGGLIDVCLAAVGGMAKWEQPTFESEVEAFKEASAALDIPLEALREALQEGAMSPLDGYTWCSMDNSDCNETFSLAEVDRVAARYGQDPGPLSQALAKGQTLPAPIILDREKWRSYLIAGNVRLMLCRALDLRPLVWRIRVQMVEPSV